MAEQVGKILQVRHSEVDPELASDALPNEVAETIALNLFNIDPQAEPESPLNIDLDLDQIEESEE
jgi:hypothetical protein